MIPLLVEDALVVGMTSERDVTPGGHVLVEDGVVTALHGEAAARAAEMELANRPLERLNAAGMWLLPGFVQTHVHLCQTLLRNGPDDLDLLSWLRGHVWPGEAAHDEETLELSARLGLAELLAGGTTAVLDMGTVHHTDGVFRAASALGARVTSGNALMDDPATNPSNLLTTAEDGLREAERLASTWHGAEGGRLRVALCPRFAISCTDGLLREVGVRARRDGLLVHTHASESPGELALVRERTGRENVTYLDEAGLSGPHVVLAHVVHSSPAERDLLRARGTRVVHCPSSNLKLASGICPVPEYLAAGIHVSLGADGAACNDRLDVFSEMRLAALLPKVRLGPGALKPFDVVRMATLSGAEALGLAGSIGSIEAGKRADFVLLDPDAGFALPTVWRDDPFGPLVYSFDRGHVAATYVDGEPVYHRTLKPREALAPRPTEIEAAARRLRSRRG